MLYMKSVKIPMG